MFGLHKFVAPNRLVYFMNRKLLLCFSIIVYGLKVLCCNALHAYTIPPYKNESISALQAKLLNSLEKSYPFSTVNTAAPAAPLFTFKTIKSHFPVLNNESQSRLEAAATFQKITDDARWVDSFSSEDVQSLPVGIKHEISNTLYQIGFSKAHFTKDYTELTVFARIVLPQTNEKGDPIELFFGANNVKLTHDGGLVGDANLVLLGDVFIPFNGGNWLFSLKGGFNMETGVTTNTTYATIDCNGVKEIGLQGEVQFARALVVPIDENGNQAPPTRTFRRSSGETVSIPNRVRGNFSFVASDWNDILVDISLSPFALAKHPDKFQFTINKATLDFSDLRTPNLAFPPIYAEQNLFQPSFESWRGVHISALEIALPKTFKTNTSITENRRVKFSAYNMVIDDYGVSGQFKAENLFNIDEGRTAKNKAWAFSLENIGIEIQANTLTGANFKGQIVLPLSKVATVENDAGDALENLGLNYVGLITDDTYLFSVSATEALNFDLWKAKARIAENSSIEMKVENGNFRPKAVLNGSLDISSNLDSTKAAASKDTDDASGSKLVDFNGITFQNLQLQTVEPFFQVDYFGYEGKVALANFPISIADIGLTINNRKASLGFDIALNLMESADKGFAASTRLEIIGQFQEVEKLQKWKFEKVDLASIAVEADMGAFTLNGELVLMKDDPEYGDGFAADLSVTFGQLAAETEVKAKAIFGKKTFRYWYFDTSVSLPTAATTNLISLKGFSGGASYRMVRKGYGSQFSPSGVSFTPSESTGLGVKAMVLLAIGNDNLINGGAGFEIAFNRRGGVNRMGLYGELHLMQAFEIANPALETLNKLQDVYKGGSKLEKTLEPFLDKSKTEYPATISGQAGVNAYVGIDFDFQNKALHGTLETYINVAGGILQGRGPGGRSGWAELHISKEDWYLYVGTPTDPQGIKLGVGPISVKTGNYFMVGTKLEDSPPPPQEVASILGLDMADLDYMRDENALRSGRGFAFGSSFEVDTGDLRFLMFYARFMAGAGFDIMLRDYGEASCVNTGRQVGVDGWYANGQAYAYLQGEFGIRVKLFFIKKKIPIIEGSAAVLLQAKAPNPIWMRGYLAGQFNLLGGLVKGKFRFKLSLGEECILENVSPLGGIKMIADLTPKDNSNGIDVFAAPQATFSMKVNEPIVIPEDDGDKTYKILLDKMEVKDKTGKVIEGTLDWGYNNDRVTFISTDILPPETDLTVTCQLSFQEYVNGVYRTIAVEGETATEIETRTFKTGTAPNHIPLHNIHYCYPVVNQKFMHPEEYDTGYIQLKRGQDYLFDTTAWQSTAAMANGTGETNTFAMQYQQAANKIIYTLPKLEKTTPYTFKITSSPKQKANRSNTNTSQRTTVAQLDEDNDFIVTQKKAENVSKDGHIERLSYAFSTSKYNTFSSKINAIKIQQHVTGRVNSNTIYLQSQLQTYEGFDLVELEGTTYTNDQPLMTTEAVLDDNYYVKDIQPIVYYQYPLFNSYYFKRDTDVLGVIPKKALPIIGSYLEGLKYDTKLAERKILFPYIYNLPQYYEQDIYDINVQINDRWAAGLITNSDPAFAFLDKYYEFMRYGAYGTTLKYTLPGGIAPSTKRYNFKNPLKAKL